MDENERRQQLRRKKQKRKRMKRRLRILKRVLLCILIVAFVVVALVAIFKNVFKVKNISIQTIFDESSEKNKEAWYSPEELKEFIFKEDSDYNTILFYLKDKFGKKVKIPYVETYEVKINWPSDIVINVYEKKIIGYLQTEEGRMYFDKDGMVVDKSDELITDIPQVIIPGVGNAVLHEEIVMPSSEILPAVLEIKQQLDDKGIYVEEIRFDDKYNITMKKDKITIKMGEPEYLTEKVHEYAQMYSKLEGLRGTLYLEDCNGQEKNIYFKPQ